MYKTLFIAKNDIKEIHKILDANKYSFWYMYKSGGIRLRIQTEQHNHIQELLNIEGIEYFCQVYEPEINIFGGEQSIEIVHQIFTKLNRLLYNQKIDTLEKKFILILFIVEGFKLDSFEKWDVWRKLKKFRKMEIDSEEILLKLLPTFYRLHRILKEKKAKIEDDELLIAKIDELRSLQEEGSLTRGIRGIYSSLVIFFMNMIGLGAKEQVALVNAMNVINHPDFEEVFYG